MQLTIERLRTMTLAAGVLLIGALVVFLAIGKWKKPFMRDIPSRLGAGIEQEANGFTRVEFRAGHTLYKIHALHERRLTNNHVLLHDVDIEMYGSDDGGVDRIKGNEFEWDDSRKTATATGQVEITISHPRVARASGPNGPPAEKQTAHPNNPQQTAAAHAPEEEIHLQTSGLTFDQTTGVASTEGKVVFSLAQGSGSAVGAAYDSQQGRLVLDRVVELDTRRGAEPVHLLAQHAEFDRDAQLCQLTAAKAEYRGGNARADQTSIHFRQDGSTEQLDASGGVVLATATGGRLAAPAGTLRFDAQNQPIQGQLKGGVIVDSHADSRTMHGAAPSAELEFTAGVLRRVHLERNVTMATDEHSQSGSLSAEIYRTWASPLADLEFRTVGKAQEELSAIHGTGGVVVTSESRRGNSPVSPSRMTADDVIATFAGNAVLKTLTGVGHASIADTTPAGARQMTSGDRLDAKFAPQGTGNASQVRGAGSAQIENATISGHVLMVQQPAAKPGTASPPELRATGERAVYEGAGEWVHLTGGPRLVDGGLQLTADKIDMSQAAGTTFAHGNVKASWFGNGQQAATPAPKSGENQKAGPGLGGEGPAHVVAAEAEMQQSTGEATFRGQARLWQQGSSVAAPAIVLNRTKQTLAASTSNPGIPVRVVLVNTTNRPPGKSPSPDQPSVIRVKGGDFSYSDADRKAMMQSGVLGSVLAETAEATTRSDRVELILLPAETGPTQKGTLARVDRMTARGHVTIDSEGRKGAGEQLVYSGATGEYTLTGTAGAPPRIVDPARGTVTGEALIFNNRDDSVTVQGGGPNSVTETTAPKRL